MTEIWCPPADGGVHRLFAPMREPEPLPEQGAEPDDAYRAPDPEVQAAEQAYLDAVADRNDASPGAAWAAERDAAAAWDAYQQAIAEPEREAEPEIEAEA